MNTRPLVTRLACSAALAATLLAGAAAPSQAATARPAAATVVTHHATGEKPAAVKKAKKAVKKKVVKKKATPKKVAAKTPAVVNANLTAFESALLSDINNARKDAGLGPLIAVPGYTDVARKWSLQLAEDDALSHNPNIVNQIQGSGGGNWTWIGENVGDGPATDEPGLFAAYMASPHHRDNILDVNGKYIGIGAIAVIDPNGDPAIYNTCDFADSYSPSYGPDKTPALADTISLSQAQAALS